MYSWHKKLAFIAISLVSQLGISYSIFAQEPGYYGIGREATENEIAGWDIDVRPDGKGLPAVVGLYRLVKPYMKQNVQYAMAPLVKEQAAGQNWLVDLEL
jgi:hypothetical protein